MEINTKNWTQNWKQKTLKINCFKHRLWKLIKHKSRIILYVGVQNMMKIYILKVDKICSMGYHINNELSINELYNNKI